MLKPAHILAASFLALALAGPAPAADPTADTVVATVNGTDITLGNLIAARMALPAQYQSLPDDVLLKGLLDQVIQQVALSQTAEKTKVKGDDLAMQNENRGYLASVLLSSVADKAVTDETLKKAYDEKYAKAAPSTEYQAAHILVKSEDEAKAIKADLDKGGDFAAIAKEKSTDKGSAANGGDLGWFGTGMMVKPFEEAVVKLKKGEVSGPIQTDFGWHIIKLNDTRVAAAPKFDDVKEELAGDLRQKAVEAEIKSIEDASKIERKIDGIDPTILKNTALIGK